MVSLQDQEGTLGAHNELIQEYQEHGGPISTEDAALVQSQFVEVLNSLSDTVHTGDTGSTLRTQIHQIAGKHDISIARFESVSTNTMNEPVDRSDLMVQGVAHTVRVEIEGRYNSVVRFMNELQNGSMHSGFESFRMTPIGDQAVRVTGDLRSMVLTKLPVEMDLSGVINE
ncbi:MAG: hypothetical protein AB8C13_03675 [Phycisphaerales bacterium]